MTNKEAAEYLSALLDDEYAFTEKDKAVFRLAIKALEQEECEDVISRDYLLSHSFEIEEDGAVSAVVDVMAILNAPQALPKQKTGQK